MRFNNMLVWLVWDNESSIYFVSLKHKRQFEPAQKKIKLQRSIQNSIRNNMINLSVSFVRACGRPIATRLLVSGRSPESSDCLLTFMEQ